MSRDVPLPNNEDFEKSLDWSPNWSADGHSRNLDDSEIVAMRADLRNVLERSGPGNDTTRATHEPVEAQGTRAGHAASDEVTELRRKVAELTALVEALGGGEHTSVRAPADEPPPPAPGRRRIVVRTSS